MRRWVIACAVVLVLAGCSDGTGASDDTRTAASPPTTASAEEAPVVPRPTGPTASEQSVPTPAAPEVVPSIVDGLADQAAIDAAWVQLSQLGIDDRPAPGRSYDRSDWPHWHDIDGNGCDARQQALIDDARGPVQVDPAGCRVVAGDWFSDYDGVELDNPSDLDVDHLVPLANAHTTGGWRWEAPQRRSFANDPANLWAVSASSNRSKSSATPDQWRPERQESWCPFAVRWTAVKHRWELSITTEERDALGQMLDSCDESSDLLPHHWVG